ncbi:MAG: substrate-binding domain-containing protein [Candidatus Dormibacteria bacterium]
MGAEGKPTEHTVIGVLSPVVVGSYMNEVIFGAAAAADAAGARLVAIQTLDLSVEGMEVPVPHLTPKGGGEEELVVWPAYSEASVPRFMRRAAWDRIAGFIVLLNAVEPWYLHALREAGKPVVIVSDEVPGFPCPVVRTDNRTGLIQAVSHLVGHGHRRIGFAGSLLQADIRERLDAYREALVANGIAPTDDLFFPATDNLEGGGEIAAHAMLAAGMPSTAVVAATDYNALGIMRVLRQAGLSLPNDQAIVGFDDVDESSLVRPTLSTVHQSVQEAARLATDLLLDLLGGREVAAGRHLVPASFVPRESCGCTTASAVDDLGDANPQVDTSPRDRLQLRLERHLLGRTPTPAPQAAALKRAVEMIVRCVAPTTSRAMPDCFQEAAEALASLTPRTSAITATMACLREYGKELQTRPRGRNTARLEERVAEMLAELSQCLAQSEANAQAALHRGIGLAHQLSMSFLSGSAGDPRALGWLSQTTARAGCLGLWSKEAAPDKGDHQVLDIAGSYLREGERLRLPAQARIEEFPPRALLQDLEWGPGEIAVILPAKTKGMDLGLLSIVTPTDITQITGYDRLFEESALLSVSIEREVMTERLRRSNADLATFSHAMAHDLRNPLATIGMWASVARMRAGPGDDAGPVLQVVAQIKDVADYAMELVADLLHYAELDRGDTALEPVDLNQAAARVIATIGSSIAQQGALIETGQLPIVPGRPGELQLVLQNLIANAIKYRGDQPPRVRLDAVREGDAWKIRCRDNGQGIPGGAREQVFEPFTRGQTSVPGSGLGLATCRRIVEGHGGRIWIASSGNLGTTVAFTLPAGPEPEPGEAEAPPAPAADRQADAGAAHPRQSQDAA